MASSFQVRILILSREVGYLFWVWMNSEKSYDKSSKQVKIKLSLAYIFRKMFFIGQNLKHVHMTYSFLELFIFFGLTLDIISHHTKEILYVNTNFMGIQSWNT